MALDESRTYDLRLPDINDAGILIAMPSCSSLVMTSLGMKASLILGETLLYGIGAPADYLIGSWNVPKLSQKSSLAPTLTHSSL